MVIEENIVVGKTAVVVAHPDDEVLWSGGLLARHSGLDVICCSIPYRDPERALCFFRAMKFLGHHPFLLPFSEQNGTTPLAHLGLLDLDSYDTIITHNATGEYGHLHHKQVHEHIAKTFNGNIYCFGFGSGDVVVNLTAVERDKRMTALKCYDNKSGTDGGLKKWDALLKKYDIDLDREFYIRFAAKKTESACESCNLSNEEIRARSDYQIFKIDGSGISGVGERMQKKLQALEPVLPKFSGLSVLDIGCDFGFWSFIAAINGADVIGLDRSRPVKGLGRVNLPLLNNQTAKSLNLRARFFDYEAGAQWFDFNKFDLVLCMSLYHHIYNICRDHSSIWYWLSRVTRKTLLWENPVDCSDGVVQTNVSKDLWPFYTKEIIRNIALKYFDIDYEGPALHEPTRIIWRLRAKIPIVKAYRGIAQSGSGGASKAFAYSNNRRILEIQKILGKTMIPGSLNLTLDENFDWESNFVRARLLDLVDRKTGLSGQWAERWVRFYPLLLGDTQAWALRFEGERYPLNFVELVSDQRLRPLLTDDGRVSITSG
jgi:hypothetical protein